MPNVSSFTLKGQWELWLARPCLLLGQCLLPKSAPWQRPKTRSTHTHHLSSQMQRKHKNVTHRLVQVQGISWYFGKLTFRVCSLAKSQIERSIQFWFLCDKYEAVDSSHKLSRKTANGETVNLILSEAIYFSIRPVTDSWMWESNYMFNQPCSSKNRHKNNQVTWREHQVVILQVRISK